MWSSVGLCVLGLLCLHKSVFGQAGVLIFCDDPSVDMAVSGALDEFNKDMSTGNKLALYQILSASKSENGSDSVYSLQFTSRKSDCKAGSSKLWKDCNYLPGRSKAILCNATVVMTDAQADTRDVRCQLDHVVPEKASCLGCPEEIDVSAEELKHPLSVSISKYNSLSDSTHLFTLNNVVHATRQVVAGFRFKVRFDMKKTTCSKAEHKDLNELCLPDQQEAEFANCNSTVDVAPWRLEPPQAHVECEAGALDAVVLTRRRPAGWSPLRNLEIDPSPPPVREESSEEELSTAPPSTNDSPFHCPSKPWKPYSPNAPAATAPPAVEEATPHPDGFSDADLLG